jgi:hypothetical protein
LPAIWRLAPAASELLDWPPMTPHERSFTGCVLAFLGLAFLLACGMGGSANSSGAGSPSGFDGGTFPGTGGSPMGGFGNGGAAVIPGRTDGGQSDLPPEQEVDASFQVPVATGDFVWIANPQSGRVAYVDAATLTVKTVAAGNAPTYIAAVPGSANEVVVFNVLSHDATILRSDAGLLNSVMVPGVAPLANAWALSPDGHFALAWTDSRRALASATGHSSLEGFQDLSVIDLTAVPPAAVTVTVGYRPVSVTFSGDARAAYVVTTDGVSVVELAGPVKVSRDVALTDDPNEDADTRDVSITPGGKAVVRREGQPAIRIVDLATGTAGTITLSGPVTDLDVTPDGTRAIAVVRDTSEIAIVPLATTSPDPNTVLRETIGTEVIGSAALTADGKQAILYSNAAASERLTVVDLTTGTYRIVHVHAPVLSAIPTPDGQYAVVLHRLAAATPDAGPPAVDGGARDAGSADAGAVAPAALVAANAFSVIPLDGSRAGRIQETSAPPVAVALSPASDHALVTVRDDRGSVFGAYLVGIPGLDVTTLKLASPPIATGVVATTNRGYVAQSHPEGRITFIPFSGASPQTLTGFDLGARVVDGVSP